MVSDRPETQTDVTLSAEETETSEEQPQFTQAQLDEAKRQAQSDALSDVGRMQRESEYAVKQATAANERIKKMLKEQEDAELKAAEGEPEQLSAVKERIRRRQVETELDEATLKLDQSNEELSRIKEDSAKTTKAEKAREVATRLGVDADRLIRLSKLTDGSVDSMEELAKELPKAGVRPPTRTDSGVSTGGGGKTTYTSAQIEDRAFYEANREDILLAQKEGRIKV